MLSQRTNQDFNRLFEQLTGNTPFPWQRELYQLFAAGEFRAVCDIPTGLGKTSLIYLWLLAHAVNPKKVPRRLVYVVNRRTVVDPASDEARRLRDKLERSLLGDLRVSVSTLRGEFADSGEWWRDPSRPAIIVGTIDLVGSALLFSSYRAGMKHRPFHAGLLGQDTLLVHDEAHLSKPFQELLVAIEAQQKQERDALGKPLRVIALTATPNRKSEKDELFELTAADHADERVRKRLDAKKGITFHQVGSEKAAVAEKVAELALRYKDEEGLAILVFVRSLDDIDRVAAQFRRAKLGDEVLKVLTGTIRGHERDQLVDTPVFQRFLTGKKTTENKTVYLLANSAGEVGIDISADHLVCDLTPYESMAQRFGRVNRRGEGNADIDIAHEIVPFEPEKKFEQARRKTLDLLRSHLPLRSDNCRIASPEALRNLPRDERQDAFSPAPTILPTNDILFDSWALTTVSELPGRPPVDAWLHGEEEDADETHFAWRTEVELLRLSVMGENRLRERTKQVRELMENYPLKSFELVRIQTSRVKDHIRKLAKRSPDATAWVLGRRADPRLTTLSELAEDDYPSFAGRTIVLGPHTGGLTAEGRFDGGAEFTGQLLYDVADTRQTRHRFEFVYENGEPKYVWNGEDITEGAPDANKQLRGLTLVAEIPLEEAEDGTSRYLLAYVGPEQVVGDEAQSRRSTQTVLLTDHNAQVGSLAANWAAKLDLSSDVQTAVRIAAHNHDLGKDRSVWQRGIGNRDLDRPLAKSGHSQFLQGLDGYRHEFGSLIDVHAEPEFSDQTVDVKDLILHLIAAHHGYGRPHFPAERAFDPQTPSRVWESLPSDVVQRFARLQAIYGRWGLAYLESLIRSADIAASQDPALPNPKLALRQRVAIESLPAKAKLETAICVRVDPTNPGQFFACCGLLELADRCWSGVKGWFTHHDREFAIAGSGDLTELIQKVCTAEMTLLDSDDIYSGRVRIGDPFRPLVLDWWHESGGKPEAKDLKVWAGTMESHGIARAMQHAMRDPKFLLPDLFDVGLIAYDPNDATKKKEPFYFDARRGPNAHSRDVGFSPNDLALTTTAFPAVELLCLVGLQRCLPAKTDETRIYDYFTWSEAVSPSLLPAAVTGQLSGFGGRGYRFENWFRTGQKKHKAFRSATPLSSRGSNE